MKSNVALVAIFVLSSLTAQAKSEKWWRVFCSGNPAHPACAAILNPGPQPSYVEPAYQGRDEREFRGDYRDRRDDRRYDMRDDRRDDRRFDGRYDRRDDRRDDRNFDRRDDRRGDSRGAVGTWGLTGALCPSGTITNRSAVVGSACRSKGSVECNFDGQKYYLQLRCN